MREKKYESDVLCVGGGIVGLMAAIRAADLGASVIVAEKGNTLRSGSGATGNDHFLCYIPEIHGPDKDLFLNTLNTLQMREQLAIVGKAVGKTFADRSFELVQLWDDWGIPMKYRDKWHFAGHAYPGSPRIFLKFAGKDQKRILTQQAIKRGVQILNRYMITDLLGDQKSVTGAIGISSREDTLIRFEAKSVIMGTGRAGRLYPSLTPGYMFNIPQPGTLTGDGRAMAYRIGAELVNLEIPKSHAGPKYISRYGQATWVGVLRDPQGKPIGPFLSEPDTRFGDITTEVDKNIFAHYANTGTGPVYMDSGGISDEDYAYMLHWMENEGNSALVDHMRKKGLDNRVNPVEWMSYPTPRAGRILMNEKSETSVPGLYTGGDEAIGGIGQAAVSGWIAAERAVEYNKQKQISSNGNGSKQLEELETQVEQKLRRGKGPNWWEANLALQQILSDYAGRIRSTTILEAGLNHLNRLRKTFNVEGTASNQHEISRCLELTNLFDLGEAVFLMSLDRKETRGQFIRTDCPYTNPLWTDKIHTIKKVNGQPVMSWINKKI